MASTKKLVVKVETDPKSWPVVTNENALAEAFTEWDRRYREEPERFMSEAEHLLKETPETYGQACAPYLIALLRGVV